MAVRPGNALSIAWDPTVSGGTSPQAINFNLGTDGTTSGLSQIGTAFTVGQINQDGVQFGNFSGVTINQAGIVTANYDNGLTRPIYILPIGTFSNPDGLQPQSGNTYRVRVDGSHIEQFSWGRVNPFGCRRDVGVGDDAGGPTQ